MGIDIDGRALYTLLFADNHILIARDEYDTDYMMRKLCESYGKAGLSVNLSKTKFMVIEKYMEIGRIWN